MLIRFNGEGRPEVRWLVVPDTNYGLGSCKWEFVPEATVRRTRKNLSLRERITDIFTSFWSATDVMCATVLDTCCSAFVIQLQLRIYLVPFPSNTFIRQFIAFPHSLDILHGYSVIYLRRHCRFLIISIQEVNTLQRSQHSRWPGNSDCASVPEKFQGSVASLNGQPQSSHHSTNNGLLWYLIKERLSDKTFTLLMLIRRIWPHLIGG